MNFGWVKKVWVRVMVLPFDILAANMAFRLQKLPAHTPICSSNAGLLPKHYYPAKTPICSRNANSQPERQYAAKTPNSSHKDNLQQKRQFAIQYMVIVDRNIQWVLYLYTCVNIERNILRNFFNLDNQMIYI